LFKAKEKIVTLLAAIPCLNAAKRNAFVMTADSQETTTEYDDHGQPYEVRRTVQKIAPINIGRVQVVIAGSGDAPLVLAFIEKVTRKLRGSQIGTVNEFVNLAELELMEFYQADVAASNGGNLSMFIAAAFPSTGEFGAWQQYNVTLVPITEPTLEGWRHNLYVKILERACHADLTTEQATLAGIHVLSVAEATSNYVRGPMSVVVIDERGILPEESEYIKDMAERLTSYEERLSRIFLTCANTTVEAINLEDLIEEFKRDAVALHIRHMNEQGQKTSLEDLLHSDKPLRRIPLNIDVGTSGYSIVHDREKLKERGEALRQAKQFYDEQIQKNPRIVDVKDLRRMHCTPCNRDFWGKSVRAEGAMPRIEGKCPTCGTDYKIEHPDAA
jgi:hypothetical protein